MNRNDSLLKNFKDETWRLENLYKIRDKQGKIIPFKLNEVQRFLNNSKAKKNMTLKARQKGVTTYYGLKYFNRACFQKNYTAALISHDRESIERIFRPIRIAYEKMHPNIRPELDKGGGSKYQLYFPKENSRIYVSLEVRSESVNDLHVSEYGLMKNKDRFNASIDAVPIDGEISIESTPRGMNHFYSDYRDPEFPFKKHLFPWYIDKEYSIINDEEIIYNEDEANLIIKAKREFNVDIDDAQIKWRRDKLRTKGKDSFFEEFLEDDISCFLASGESVLDLFYVKSILDNYVGHIEEIDGIKIYEKADVKHSYVVGADTSGGDGGDYNVATVYRVSDMAQCAQFRNNKIRPAQFASKLVDMCRLYKVRGKMPLLGVERNNHGHAVLLALSEIEKYPNLYFADDGKIGWLTNMVTRNILVDTFIEAFEARMLRPRDKDLLKECLVFVNNNGKIEASSGEHDDTIIASAIALQMIIKERPSQIYENAQENFLV